MKKLILSTIIMLISWQMNSQASATIAIQFYVDANNNCSYNFGEQLVYNVPVNLNYSTTTSSIQTTWGGTGSLTTCGAFTLYLWSQSATPVNTLNIQSSFGVVANLSCSNYTNIPYNTNNTQYLPVTLTGTNTIGTQVNYVNYYSSLGTYTFGSLSSSNNTIGICSNIGSDSLVMSFIIHNYFNCTVTGSMSPRTYSLYLDGVTYDNFTTTGPFFSNSNVTGVNVMSWASESYMSSQTYLTVYPRLPATFTALGSHTFEVRSSMIYNNPTSVLSFSCILNSIPCSKISGRFYNDCNNNCTFDGTDNYNIGTYARGKVYNVNTGYNLTFYPNASTGRFTLYLPPGNSYSLAHYPTYTTSPNSFTACSNATITIPPAATTNTFLFGYKSAMVGVSDPGVYLNRLSSTSNIISPGVGATFGITLYNNWWNVCASSSVNPGKVKVTLPKFISYVSTVSGPSPTLVAGASLDTLIWTAPNFSNTGNWWNTSFSSFSVVVSMTAVANTPFSITTRIFPTNDVNLANNISYFNRVIDGPFDPNEKVTEVQGLQSNGDVPFGTQQFYYKVGFQNIGKAPAINVKTVDTIDVNFDLSTLQVLQSSFPVNTQIDDVARQVIFNFEGIYLPAASVNEPKSHGFVRYGIKLKPGVPLNTVLKNRGHNYFDFNEPVATNQTVNKLTMIVGISENQKLVKQFKLMPNPFADELSISAEEEIREVSVYNELGQLIMQKNVAANQTSLSLDGQPSGIYFLSVTFKSGEVVSAKAVRQ